MFEWLLTFFEANFKFTAISGGIAVASCVPIAATIVSVQNKKSTYLFREFSIEESENAPKKNSFSDFKPVEYSYEVLLQGTKSYNNGNYVIYIGSELCPYCNIMMYNQKESFTEDSVSGRGEKYKDGSFYNAYKTSSTNPQLKKKNIKFLFFSDPVFTSEGKKIDSFPWAPGDPKNPDRYKRQDKSAVEFRKIRDYSKTVLPSEKVSAIPTVIVYKDAKPHIFGEDKFEELEPHLNTKEADINSPDESSKSKYENKIKNWLLLYIYYCFEEQVLSIPGTTIAKGK